jgi:hypothetical protein
MGTDEADFMKLLLFGIKTLQKKLPKGVALKILLHSPKAAPVCC